MAMRSQIYEWDASRSGHGGQPIAASNTLNTARPYSIFIGGVGNNITKPAETTATQFVVIEDIGCTASDLFTATSPTNWIDGPRAYIQVRINTTDYFLDPDNIGNDGIPGTASPYPRTIAFQPSFNLYPDVYVLPGQTWSVLYKPRTAIVGAGATSTCVACFVKYTLYDGPDALIANRLLEMGVTVNPNNVDWYKRTLIEGGSQ